MKINVEELRGYVGSVLAQDICKGLDAFYSDPEHRRQFAEWKAKREGAGVQEEKPAAPLIRQAGQDTAGSTA